MEHRRKAQAAVDEQERKLAELVDLQAALRSRLNELESAQEEDLAAAPAPAYRLPIEEEEEEEEEYDEDEGQGEYTAEEDAERTAEKLLSLITIKTSECEKLAAVVEEARDPTMLPAALLPICSLSPCYPAPRYSAALPPCRRRARRA